MGPGVPELSHYMEGWVPKIRAWNNKLIVIVNQRKKLKIKRRANEK